MRTQLSKAQLHAMRQMILSKLDKALNDPFTSSGTREVIAREARELEIAIAQRNKIEQATRQNQ